VYTTECAMGGKIYFGDDLLSILWSYNIIAPSRAHEESSYGGGWWFMA
jgi:hypothetical protein